MIFAKNHQYKLKCYFAFNHNNKKNHCCFHSNYNKKLHLKFQVTHFLNNEAKGTKVIGATSLQDMVNKLKTPRKIMLLVKGKNLNKKKNY